MAEYFVLECKGKSPVAAVFLVTDTGSIPWMNGAPVDAPAGPVEYKVNPDYPGNLRAMYQLAALAMSDDLLAAIQGCGVDNLQVFDAVLRDPVKKITNTNYKAVNILGLVSLADPAKSKLMHEESLTGMDHDYESLAFDKGKMKNDLLMFRLAESVNAIVVHEKVKRAIEKAQIPGMVFFESGEWSG